VLFDGGVLDNLPVAVMVADDEGPVLAVDVTPRRWTGRGRRGGQLPGIVDTISRSAILGGSQDAADSHRLAHLVIEPSPPDVGQLGFERLDEIIESGRIATRTALEHASALVDDLVDSQ
jgi:predicted acylesterase/phospholipase RssA